MKFSPIDTSILDWSGDALAVGLFADRVELTADLAKLDDRLAGTLKETIAEVNFKGQSGECIATRVGGGSPIRKAILVGLGSAEEPQLDEWRIAAAAAAKAARTQKCKTLAIAFPPYKEDAVTTTEAIVEGATLGLHQDRRFKSQPDENDFEVETIELIGLAGQEAAIDRAGHTCAGVILARELVAAPANEVTPLSMAEMAQQLAKEGGFEIEILEREECEQRGMGAFLGVAQASDMPPKFVHLTYKPSGSPRKKVAIVGKGLTFDSGGLNLKTGGSGIEMMKEDMAGSAAAFGAAKAIAPIKPDVEVHFISAVTENMISGRAMHPGDILKASNGKTIEVNNTDAEGRLTLADALVFADALGVDAIVDLATLTGACVVALGDQIAGIWSPDDSVAEALVAAGEKAGEKLWRMPMEQKYFEGMKSIVADMKNTGPRPGGAITAALFLKEFVDKTPWAHIDLAGPVWTEKESGYNNPGATGFAVRTLVNWVLA